ncbi:UNVERIFIED_CONTAM: hypothetical protein FKN15_018377 [Acipenser sinensis]
MMNERFLKAFQIEQNLCIDEAMITYYGKHSAKQFMKSKPIQFGYKLWCLNTHQVYQWNDNSVVTMASNCQPVMPIRKAKRYSRAEKKVIEVDEPQVIRDYNKYMGGPKH